VRINGIPTGAGHRLAAGDRLSLPVAHLPEPPVARHFTVLYADDQLLVVNKPAPLPCHPRGSFYNNTLWRLLIDFLGHSDIYPVNRLDRQTSGIVLYALTKKAAAGLARQFKDRQVEKGYYVIVAGEFPRTCLARGVLRDNPGRLAWRKMFVAGAIDGGKYCETAFTLCQQLDGCSLLAARPVTGRQHQIRATLQALGHPVVGDLMYGATADNRQHCSAGYTMNRQALHAAFLAFTHPASGRRCRLFAPMPPDMRLCITQHGGRLQAALNNYL